MSDRHKTIQAVRDKCAEASATTPIQELARLRIHTNLEVCALLDEIDQTQLKLREREEEIDVLRNAVNEIDLTLRVPAAEYVPAISDVFKIIDRLSLKYEGK